MMIMMISWLFIINLSLLLLLGEVNLHYNKIDFFLVIIRMMITVKYPIDRYIDR